MTISSPRNTPITLPAIAGEMTLSGYMDQISQFPYLTQAEEVELANRWYHKQDLSAAHNLVTSHLRLVVKIANGFKGYGLPVMELVSEGNIGLMQAVKKFDPTKGFRLSTYAMWWIKASIQEYVLHSWSLVKIGTTSAQKKLFFSLRKIKNRLKKIDNTQLDVTDVELIAQELDVSTKDVIDMDRRLTQGDSSLNVPAFQNDDGHSGGEMIDYIESENESQEHALVAHDDMDYKRRLFAQALAQLSEREQYIIQQRKLLDKPATLEKLSLHFHISRERIRQIEARALEKVQEVIGQLMTNDAAS